MQDQDDDGGVASALSESRAQLSKTALERSTMTSLKLERYYEDLLLETEEREKRYGLAHARFYTWLMMRFFVQLGGI